MKLEIRKVRPDELIELQELGARTFLEAFGSQNTKADIDHYISHAFDLEKVKKELENKASYFYFGLIDGKKIAYLKLNEGDAQTEDQLAKAMEIERIYVLSNYQGNNIGERLIQKAVDIAIEINKNWIWLGVWEKNVAAIRFYQRHGFQIFAQHQFMLGSDEQTDIIMKKALPPRYFDIDKA